jgi:mRNA interferase MazF
MNPKPKLPSSGEIVVVDFPGATGTKRRPALILSSTVYHKERPDVILGVITSQLGSANCATDHVLQDWDAAGLHKRSAFRAFVVTVPQSAITASVGRLSKSDWLAVCQCMQTALATS